jgi:hypothetical protein
MADTRYDGVCCMPPSPVAFSCKFDMMNKEMSGPHGNTHDKGRADRADSTAVEGHHLTCAMATAMMWCRCVSPWC